MGLGEPSFVGIPTLASSSAVVTSSTQWSGKCLNWLIAAGCRFLHCINNSGQPSASRPHTLPSSWQAGTCTRN
jgi:hypothetical protein